MSDRLERAALLALTEVATAKRIHWYEVADLVELAGSASAVAEGTATFYEDREIALLKALSEGVTEQLIADWSETVDHLLDAGQARLLTVLDEEYPINLRRIYNRPPFLFVRGTLQARDQRSVAVVGTRRASREGRRQARQLATELARLGVTVVSGLAAGIDTEAHTGALDAGGRTVAVTLS